MEQYIFTDQMGKSIELGSYPQRIISLVPSQTELLFYLGLGSNIVGRTKFCIHPTNKIKLVPEIGGTKTPRLNDIIALNPDLVIGNKEENEINSIHEIEKVIPVWMSDIKSVDDALEMIKGIGLLTNTSQRAELLIKRI
ncbi:MAG TPA: helical backbone metal receptor, partial [Saprospiraceae bacterium]|nr:helical backbone metal receptor [Saprospiraceae bacterium]